MNAAMVALRKNLESTFPLQITSMIDMFTIILVFLLKSYTSSSIDLTPTQSLNLPMSSSVTQPVEALKVVVSKAGIFVDDKEVVKLDGSGGLPTNATEATDRRFIRGLYNALHAQAEKTKSIAKQNESVKFEGRIVFQADQAINYTVIKKVMYTAAIAGFSDFKLAVTAPN